MVTDKWLPVSIAPFEADLELAVIDKRGVHALIFPCRRTAFGWADAPMAGHRAYALASMDREPQLVSFFGRFIYLLQVRLLLGKEATKHCPLGWVSFGVKHQLEPVDIGLNNSFQEGPPVKSDIRGPLPRTCLIELLGAAMPRAALEGGAHYRASQLLTPKGLANNFVKLPATVAAG